MGSLSSLTWIEAWFGTPSIRWKAFKFLWRVIWKTEADPCLRQSSVSRLKKGVSKHVPAGDNRPSEEEGPDAEPPLAISLQDLVLVANPVLVPAVDSGRVVDAQNINVLDLETSTLELDLVVSECPLRRRHYTPC